MNRPPKKKSKSNSSRNKKDFGKRKKKNVFNKEIKKQFNCKDGEVLKGSVTINPKGFGFFIPFDSEKEHLYMGENEMINVMNRDHITIKAHIRPGFSKASLISVDKRAHREIMCRCEKRKDSFFFISTDAKNKHIAFFQESTSRSKKIKLNKGDHYLAEIKSYPGQQRTPASIELIEKIEHPNHASLDTVKTLVSYGWTRSFSKKCIEEAEDAAQGWKKRLPSQHKDLTHLPFVTIDGADAKDFDDAIYVQKINDQEYKLYVAIADVSLFVTPGSQLDQEANSKSTSVYFPDYVEPMLPEVLSNGMCSLNPHEDRPAMTCEMTINSLGQITDFKFFEGIIKSHKRFTYENVEEYLKHQKSIVDNAKVMSSIEAAQELFNILIKARIKRQTLDLEVEEAHIHVDSEGQVLAVGKRERLEAHKLIEEFMLAANQSAAKFISQNFDQGMFRVHLSPEEKKLKALIDFASKQGLSLDNSIMDDLAHKPIQLINKILKKSRAKFPTGTAKRLALENMSLRTMQQAIYSEQNKGHFALNLENYTHFTSPIRRYPDLCVHRLIRQKIYKGSTPTDLSKLSDQAAHCSKQERTAMECERTLIDIKKCRFLTPHIGKEFEAWVAGVTEKGLFCRITDQFIDGFVHGDFLYKSLKAKYSPKEETFVLKSGKPLSLGTQLRILVAQVDLESRKIDFEIVEIYH